MLLKEFNLNGVYLAPFAVYFILAVAVYIPVHRLLDRREIGRWVWHRNLFDFSVFIIILSLIGLIF